MPANEKGEWTNPFDSHQERNEYIGYKVCSCKEGVELLQAGYDVQMYLCSTCKREVADAADFFKYQDGVRAMSK